MSISEQPKKSLSIRGKLILIGVLFVVNTLAIEALSTYTQIKVSDAIAESTLRQGQLSTLADMEVALVDFILTGMDAIIDRDSGKIEDDLKNKMVKASTLWRNKLPTLKEMADTEQEKVFARELGEIYPTLEKAILTDLTQLITAKADKAAFEEIDDRIDKLGQKIDKPLIALVVSVKNENAEATQVRQQQIGTASFIRRTLAIVMLVIVIGALFLIARSILRPILAACALVQDVAEGQGDLTKRLQVGCR